MARSFINTPDTPKVRKAAVEMVKALYGEKAGVLTSELKAAMTDPDQMVWAARWLREMGVALVAERARHLSRWHLAPVGSAMYDQWQKRILADYYATTVRAYRAVSKDPDRAEIAKALRSQAAAVGQGILDKTGAEVDVDLTSTPMPPAFAAHLRAGGYII